MPACDDCMDKLAAFELLQIPAVCVHLVVCSAPACLTCFSLLGLAYALCKRYLYTLW